MVVGRIQSSDIVHKKPLKRKLCNRDNDPYGNMNSATGSEWQSNPYRFSTKYLDAETNLYYYGYRFYAPELGRWINRDPITEKGGNNIYEFAINNSINSYDVFGLWASGASKYILGLFYGHIFKSMTYITHGTITHEVFESVKGILQKGDITDSDALWLIESEIIRGNNSQDYLHPFDHRRHYTFPDIGEPKKNATQRINYRDLYVTYLAEEKTEFTNNIGNSAKCGDNNIDGKVSYCLSALYSLGALSHSWQDYFGHGINSTNDMLIYTYDISNLNNIGDPYNRVLQPALYVGEHPGSAYEPVDSASPETYRYSLRLSMSKDFTKKMFEEKGEYFDQWLSICGGKCMNTEYKKYYQKNYNGAGSEK